MRGGSEMDMAQGVMAPPSAFFAIPLEHLAPDTVLGFDLYLRHGQNDPILYRHQDLEFTMEVLDRLVDNGVKLLLVPQGQMDAYQSYRQLHPRGMPPEETEPKRRVIRISEEELGIEDAVIDRRQPVRGRAASLALVSRSVVEASFSDLGTPGLGERVRRVAEATARFLLSEPNGFSTLIAVLSRDLEAYNHAVNVAFYSTELARVVGLEDLDRMTSIGRAAMLHDIGREAEPLELLHKESWPERKQWEAVVGHAERGVEVLRRRGVEDPTCEAVCREHHERADGSGYPRGLVLEKISPEARIVAIGDIFDSLTCTGRHKAALSGFQALWRMKRDMLGKFDPALLDTFIQMMVEPVSHRNS